MGNIELLDLLKGMVGELGLGFRPNEKMGTITIFEFHKRGVAVTLATNKSHNINNPAVVVAYRGPMKLSCFLRAYDMHSAQDFEDMRSMILQAAGRPEGVPLDIQEKLPTPLYLECHIVVRPADPKDVEFMQPLLKNIGLWSSIITMDDGGEEKAGDIIFTTRENGDNLDLMRDRMLSVLDFLTNSKAKIKRYKIESAVIDSKQDDHLFQLDMR
jgi:hypothetical protein